MADKKTLTFALMDGPYEQARSTTALRLIGIAAQRGLRRGRDEAPAALLARGSRYGSFVWIQLRSLFRCRSMNAIWVEVGLCHPRFVGLALEPRREGSAKLGIE